ncbi:MAG TPA: DUF3341 domain-containing protein [Candidatus Nanopelagicales bacterium]|nr:DUF3341 domain-containing protein [Candidatus Nanopelagicales bacterium]
MSEQDKNELDEKAEPSGEDAVKTEDKAEDKAEAKAEEAEDKAEAKAEEKPAAEEKAEAPKEEAKVAEEEPVAKGKKGKAQKAGADRKKKVEEAAEEPAAAKSPVPAAARSKERDEEERPAPQPIVGDPFGLMGYFATPAEIYHACEELRDAGYTHFDAHTPFPVHGLEHAMGLKPSKLPWLVLTGGATGLMSAIALAWYTQYFDYPLLISGKPAFSYQIFIPIFFELTILLSALTCFVSVWALGKLPAHFHPTMTHPAFQRATDDAFFISVEARDPKYDAAKTRRLLEKLGAQDVQEIAQ